MHLNFIFFWLQDMETYENMWGFDLHQTSDKTIYVKLLEHEIVPKDGKWK